MRRETGESPFRPTFEQEKNRESLQERTTETLFEIREDRYPNFEEVNISPDQKKASLINIDDEGMRQVVVLAEDSVEEGEKYYRVKDFSWSEGSDAYIYVGRNRNPILPERRDSEARQGTLEQNESLVLNDEVWDQGYKINNPTIRPDADSYACAKVLPRKRTLLDSRRDVEVPIIDEKECGQYNHVSSIIYSPDSSRAAFIADGVLQWDVQSDDTAGKNSDRFGSAVMKATFSHDSQDIFYINDFGLVKNQEFLYEDRARDFAISPDDNHFALMVGDLGALYEQDPERGSKKEGRKRAYHDLMKFVLDGYEFEDSFVNLEDLTWAPDSSFVVAKTTLQMYDVEYFKGEKAGKKGVEKKVTAIQFRKTNGEGELKPGKVYDDIDKLTVSPSSEHIAYVAQEGERVFLVVDTIEHELDMEKPLSVTFKNHLNDEGQEQEFVSVVYEKEREIIKKTFEIAQKKEELTEVQKWQTRLEEELFYDL